MRSFLFVGEILESMTKNDDIPDRDVSVRPRLRLFDTKMILVAQAHKNEYCGFVTLSPRA